MSGSFFDQLEAPIVEADPANHFSAAAAEEPDMVESVNAEIERVQIDREQQFNNLIQIHNHMFEQKSKQWTDIQTLMGKAVEVKKSYDTYLEESRPYWELNDRTKATGIAGFDPNDSTTYKWIDKEIEENELYEKESQILQEATNAFGYQAIEEGNADVGNALLRGQVLSQGEGYLERNRRYHTSAATVVQDFPSFYKIAAKTFKLRLTQADGSVKELGMGNAESNAEKRLVADAIAVYYVNHHRNLEMGHRGRYKRDVAIPVFNQATAYVKQEIENLGKISEKIAADNRAEDLRSRLNNPSYFIDHINLHKGAYGNDLKRTRLITAIEIGEAAKTGVIPRQQINAILDHEFLGNDGQYHKVRDYWKEEANIMLAGINAHEAEVADNREAILQGEKDAYENKILAELAERKTPPSMEEKHQIIIKAMETLGVTYEQLPDGIKNIYTSAEVPDHDIDWQLKQKQARGEAIEMSDLRGIEDPILKKQWLDKVTGGVDTEARDDFVTAAVNEKTQERDLNQAKTIKWRAYEQNATRAYNRAYTLAKSRGANDEEAATSARKAVLDGLDIGGDDDTSWSRYGGSIQATDARMDLGRAKESLAKEPSLMNSDKPWSGEETAIKQALLTKGSVVPTYYRNFPSIRRLPNGKPATPTNLMFYRLDKLGLMKEGKIKLPEDNLPLYLQDLLRKPNSSKSLRILFDPNYNQELMPEPSIHDLMLQRLRSGSQVSQQYALIDSSYRSLVNIPSELNDEFAAQVGDLPPYLQLNNLQPEVAKAFVADVLMT